MCDKVTRYYNTKFISLNICGTYDYSTFVYYDITKFLNDDIDENTQNIEKIFLKEIALPDCTHLNSNSQNFYALCYIDNQEIVWNVAICYNSTGSPSSDIHGALLRDLDKATINAYTADLSYVSITYDSFTYLVNTKFYVRSPQVKSARNC